MVLSTIVIQGRKYSYRDAEDLADNAGIFLHVAKKAISSSKKVAKYNKDLDDLNRMDKIEYIATKDKPEDTRVSIGDVNGVKMFKYDIKTNAIPLVKRIFSLKKNPSQFQITNDKVHAVQGKIDIGHIVKTPNININVTGTVYFVFNISAETCYRKTTFYHNGPIRDILQSATAAAILYLQVISNLLIPQVEKIIIHGQNDSLDLVYDWRNMTLRDKNYQLSQWKNINYISDSDENCVIKYFREYHNIKIDHFNDEIDINKLSKLCNDNQINYYFYSINGILKMKNTDNKNKKTISLILYNNHIYPLNGRRPINRNIDYNEIIIVKDIDKNIKKLLDNKIIPYDIQSNILSDESKSKVISYTHDSIKYLCNEQYSTCFCILNDFDLVDEIYDSITINDLGSIIEKKYLDNSIDSFFPLDVGKGGFNYDVLPDGFTFDDEDIHYIDKNKAYLCVLRNLPYIIYTDWRLSECKIINKNITDVDIIPHYLYIVDVMNDYDILLPNNGKYTGYHLQKCFKYRKNIIVKEQLQCSISPNHYKKMIDDLFRFIKDINIIKQIMVVLIGKFEKNTEVKESYSYKGIFNKDESKRTTGLKINIDKKYDVAYDCNKLISYVYNRKPLAIQVKDGCRLLLFDKMIDLDLDLDNILQIRTDSIVYKGPKPELDNHFLDGWKFLEKTNIKKMNMSSDIEKVEMTFIQSFPSTSTRILHAQYAGCGKTYHIINVLVPKLIKNNVNYLILTPSHCALKEYRNNQLNCKVIQHYEFHNEIPDESYIIVDEIGMVGRKGHDFIYKLLHLGKSFECFGDFNQLVPPDTHVSFGKDHYLQYMFGKNIDRRFENFRNNFTQEYYDSLINSNDHNYLVSEVIKYSAKDYKDADVVLTYRCKSRDDWNKKIMKERKLSYESRGLKLYCNVNKQRYRDINIYNGFPLYIYDNDEKYYYLVDNMDNPDVKIRCTKKQLDEDFSPRFAMNIYNIQGDSINSYYWDINDNYFINSQSAYTIISRLKGNIFINNF
jgi:hypothetical protein